MLKSFDKGLIVDQQG